MITGSASPIVGIDLGTTNSLVAVAGLGVSAADAAPRILPDDCGRGMLPSVVRFNADGSLAIGHEAREQAVLHPESTISSVKRLMGRSLKDAAADLPYLSYRVVEGPNQTARVEVPSADAANPRMISPQEVSAVILKRLKEQAAAALGTEVTRAVVTVPAYFDDAQRQATRDAGRLAGLEVVRIINEPTAAAMAYGLGLSAGRTEPQTIVVFDLGGGTFDLSILRITPAATIGAESGAVSDFFQVLATAGDTHLGGDDFDHALVGLFGREMAARFNSGKPFELPPQARQALVKFAEQAKVRLSEQEAAAVRIDLGGGQVYERTITRAEFEALVMPLVDRTIDCCRRALKDAARDMQQDAVAAVVMVGGATRTPLVRRRVREFFKLEPYTALNPDEVVALGAAVQAATIRGAEEQKVAGGKSAGPRGLLLDVVPLSLGLETVGGAMAKLVMRNSTVPTRAHEMFSTSVDKQTAIKLNVLQGEREMAADCRSLGIFHLRGIPPMPAGLPQLRVEFAVDVNGILSVSAVERRSGKRLDVQIVPNHGLTHEEVERIERESFTHARDDMTRHRIADLVANSKLDLHWIGQTLARVEKAGLVGQATGGVEAEYIERLRGKMSQVRGLIESGEREWQSVDADRFHAAKEDLDRLSMRLHEVSIALSLRDEKK